jgi:hypothetical protein
MQQLPSKSATGGGPSSYAVGPLTKIMLGLTIAWLLCATQARAQLSWYGKSSAPISGGTGMIEHPSSSFRPLYGTFAPNHKTPDGRLCISINPSSRPQTINPKIIDQIVLIQNICGESIRVEVCYAGRSDCINVSLNGYQRLERILGISAGSTQFQYEYRELF